MQRIYTKFLLVMMRDLDAVFGKFAGLGGGVVVCV